MTTPDPLQVLQRQVAALQSDYFLLVDKIHRVGESAERNAASLDDFEELLDEVSTANANANADAMAAALQQRDAQIWADETVPAEPEDPGGPAPGPVGAASAAGAAPAEAHQFPEMDELHAWVDEHIAPLVRKTTTTGEGGGIRWCQQWTEHVDAVERLIALYLAWHELSADESATWLSVYLRDHLDPHLGTLTSPYGPFYACSPHRHSDTGEPLGQVPFAATRHHQGVQP